MPGPCPTPERLAAALRGTQPAGADAELAAHLAECPACQAQLESLAAGTGWLAAKAMTHTVVTPSEPLLNAMRALESQPGIPPPDPPTSPSLDFLRPSEQPRVIGLFGPYEVLEYVASGGMGIILKARDPSLGRVVALKLLSPMLATNSLARARFVREARAAAAVVHEHVVPIYAVDECAGLPYLVMQFVDGRSLSERIRISGSLRLEEILRIGAQAAAGLAAAHAQGLIHRDVKPGNILLENSIERVKLSDFGLARAADDIGLTRTGELAGTPEFMAPEQAGKGTVDYRADLFSLGSVLYAMCTGHSPFQGNSVVAVIRSVCDEQPPPVHELNSAIPRWLSDIVAHLMSKSPDERFQSAREVGELMERYLARVQHGDFAPLPDHPPRPTRIQRRLRMALTAGTAVALMAVGFVIWWYINKPPSSPTSPTIPTASEMLFVVRDNAGKTIGSYQDALEAIRAAPASAVIELRWNGERHVQPVTIAGKPLTLRAGASFRPIWLHTDASASALATDSALTLDGIDFVMKPGVQNLPGRALEAPPRKRDGSSVPRWPVWHSGPSGGALIAVTGGSLRASHCLLRLEGPGDDLNRLACVTADDTTSCEFSSTAVNATPGKAIVWRSSPEDAKKGSADHEASLTLSNCAVNGAPALWMQPEATSRWNLHIFRSTFLGPNVMFFPATAPASSEAVVVVAQNNIFAAGTVLRDRRRTDSPNTAIRWRESENLFQAVQAYVDMAGDSGGPFAARTLTEWNKWWMQTNHNSRQVKVGFASARTGRARGTDSIYHSSMFTITNLSVDYGPALDRDQWDRFGANTADIGPVSPK